MIVVLKNGTPQVEIDAILDEIAQLGLKPLHMPGTEKVVLGALGDERKLHSLQLEARDCVERVIPILSSYKLVSRESQTNPSTVTLGGTNGGRAVDVGPTTFTIIGGPCSVESREQIVATATDVREAGGHALRGGAYKPRSSPYSFQGLGLDGLKLLAEARQETGLPIVTECVAPRQIAEIVEHADVIQIGARNMQNFELLKEVGRQPKPVLLKRGLSATIDDLLHAAEYIAFEGNEKIMLCERGIRTFETATRNTLDLAAICVLKERTHLPVIIDPSHGTGVRGYVAAMSRAALVAGADGLIVEVHHSPDHAKSDGAQSLFPHQFKDMVGQLQTLAPMVDRKIV